MTAGRLDVPAGTQLLLLAHEIRPRPLDGSLLVHTVAVYPQPDGGYTRVTGHVCGRPDPDCGAAWCWEAQVLVAAIKANLAGAR